MTCAHPPSSPTLRRIVVIPHDGHPTRIVWRCLLCGRVVR